MKTLKLGRFDWTGKPTFGVRGLEYYLIGNGRYFNPVTKQLEKDCTPCWRADKNELIEAASAAGFGVSFEDSRYGMDKYEYTQKPWLEGVQRIITLPNGHKLSLRGWERRLPFAWEGAVIAPNGNLTYDTPLTNDVEVFASEEEAIAWIERAFEWCDMDARVQEYLRIINEGSEILLAVDDFPLFEASKKYRELLGR